MRFPAPLKYMSKKMEVKMGQVSLITLLLTLVWVRDMRVITWLGNCNNNLYPNPQPLHSLELGKPDLQE